MSTTTDKPPTIEEIREWQNQNHRYALRHHYDVKAIDFLLAEVGRRDKELDELRDCDMCEICEDHHI